MPHIIHNIGVAGQIGDYSDAVEAAPNVRWLMTSGARRGHAQLVEIAQLIDAGRI
jgi:hypothetical protein